MRKSAVLGIGLLGAAFLTTPSSSSAALSDCTGLSSTCLWANNDFGVYITGKTSNLGVSNLTASQEDRMDSWQNKSALYNSAGYSGLSGNGDCQTFAKGQNDNNVNPFNSDEVSSYRTNRGC